MVLGDQRWPDVEKSALIAVPVGSLEQHGPHLPLDTDTRIATAVAQAVPGGMLAPAIAYGASGEHDGFAGTISIGIAALETLLVEYGRSACLWASRVVFVNGHGGNASAVRAAVMLLRHEGRDVSWFPCAVPGADAHAGLTETSIMLALDPDSVSVDKLAPGALDPIDEIMPLLRAEGVLGVAPSGVLGDPTKANAKEGQEMLDALRGRFEAAVTAWKPRSGGNLA
jgi:creatinine amidohydrolase